MHGAWSIPIVALFLASSSATATSVDVKVERVSPDSAADNGIEVFALRDQMGCDHGIQFWVRVPPTVKQVILALRDSSGSVLDTPVSIEEHAPEPALAVGYVPPHQDQVDEVLLRMQRDLGFRARGFRGATFCLATPYLANTALSVSDRYPNGLVTRVWELGTLEQWVK